jgi:hypothetical protein
MPAAMASVPLCHHHQVMNSKLVGSGSFPAFGPVGFEAVAHYLEPWCLLCSGTIWSEQTHCIVGQKITAPGNTTFVRFARKRRVPLDTFWDIAKWPWEKPKVHSHRGMKDRKGESIGTFETNQNERISTDGRPRQESARLPTDTTKFRFKAQTVRYRSNPPKTSLSANLLVQ